MGVQIDRKIARDIFNLEVVLNKTDRKARPNTVQKTRTGKHIAPLAPYSENEIHAFDVLRKLNWGFWISSPMGNRKRSLNPNLIGRFDVRLMKTYVVGSPSRTGRKEVVREESVFDSADTLPLAICKAAMKAVEAMRANRALMRS